MLQSWIFPAARFRQLSGRERKPSKLSHAPPHVNRSALEPHSSANESKERAAGRGYFFFFTVFAVAFFRGFFGVFFAGVWNTMSVSGTPRAAHRAICIST